MEGGSGPSFHLNVTALFDDSAIFLSLTDAALLPLRKPGACCECHSLTMAVLGFLSVSPGFIVFQLERPSAELSHHNATWKHFYRMETRQGFKRISQTIQ